MKTIVPVLVGVSLALACAAGHAQETAKDVLKVSIERKSLRDALNDWAQQTGNQLIAEIKDDLVAPKIEGTLTAQQALERLLEGTPLTYQWMGERLVAVKEKPLVVPAALKTTEYQLKRPSLPIARFSGESWGGQRLAANDQEAARGSKPLPRERGGRNSDDVDELEEVVVTGTHIRGSTPISPVIEITRHEIDSSGAATTQQLLERLPQNWSGGLAEATTTSFVPGADEGNNLGFGTGVNLRGLGSDSTLILVNGHRLSPTGAGNFVDISQIPISAVERIEILTDGASAIYGSDAIGGVVNIILRENYEGAESRVRLGSTADGGPDEYGLNQSFGTGWDGGGALLSLDYFSRGELSRNDRTYAQLPVGDLLPDQERLSFLANVSHRLNDKFALAADAIFTSRDSKFLYPNAFDATEPNRISDSSADSWALNTAVEVGIGKSWGMEMSALVAQSDVIWKRRSLDDDSILGETFRNELMSFDLKADGEVFALPSGTVKGVIGSSYREETFRDTEHGNPARIDSRRNVTSAFGELRVPILGANESVGKDRLQLSLAARYEDYSDVGNSTNPHFGLAWWPTSELRVRGTYSTSFKAPNFSQTSDFVDAVFFLDFPDTTPSGSSLALYLAGSDPHLKPEKSTNWTVGLDFEPASLEGARWSITYFNIAFKDRVESPSSAIFDLLTDESVYGPVLTRNPTAEQIAAALAFSSEFIDDSFGQSVDDTQVIIDNRKQNLAQSDVSGVDLTGSYRFSALGSKWTAFIGGTRLLDFENQITSAAAPRSVLNTLFNPVDLRIRGGLEWNRGPWSSRLAVNYTDDYVNDTTSPEARVDSWTVVDLSTAYQTDESVSIPILRDFSIRLSVLNMFNQDPPRVLPSSIDTSLLLPVGFDAANANPLGRLISLDFTKSW